MKIKISSLVRLLTVLLAGSIFILGCGSKGGSPDDSSSDADSDTDADNDSDSDSDSDSSDTDSDSDLDTDSDTDADSDTDTYTNSDTDTNIDTDTDTETDTDADTHTGTETDTGTGMETEIDTDLTPVFGVNPIVQTKFTADPAPLVYEDTLYLYTTHDEDDATGFKMYDWMLYSTKDMVNWTDHGVVAGVRDPNRTFDWASGENAWAPQAIFRNGKFYLYCPMNRSDSWHSDIGVAVADSPTGPFVDAIGGPLIHNPDSSDDIDPTVFIDDDGQAYLYWGHKRIFYVKLNEDMISYSGEINEFERPDLFEEGPWFYRRNDKYYLTFASYCCPEGIGYAMSDGPTGPWTTMGYIMRPQDRSSGNHPGIVDFKGTTYLFGFHYELNFAETTEHRERRSICVDEMPYNDDGTINELPWWSSTGMLQLTRLNPYQQTEAETIAWASGLKTETCIEGGLNVTDIDNGDYIEVRGVSFGSGAGKFEARGCVGKRRGHRTSSGQSRRCAGGNLHRSQYRWQSKLGDRILRGQRRGRLAQSESRLHRRCGKAVQHQLVEIHEDQRPVDADRCTRLGVRYSPS